ncbi:MAG: hypothetical protein A3F13_02630 [Gammaproteobacteria bacterium RIFCSPHIGHO2_12_FULL_40_19]|nr:MAG: hypothetical protein A3F13_02630 [Gammaproteobacteria bacterium RIFCSPHIGHO2_12_FULL_40_19]
MYNDDSNPFGLLVSALFTAGIFYWGKKSGQEQVLQSYDKMDTERRFSEMQAQIFFLKRELDAAKGL